MDSVRTQLGMLVMVTSQTDEITRSSGVNLRKKLLKENSTVKLTFVSRDRPVTVPYPFFRTSSLLRSKGAAFIQRP